MPHFGAHLSISGGLHNAISSATELGCGTVQIFTKNASQWNAKPLTEHEILGFRNALMESSLKFPTAHDSYLINLASPDEAVYRRSIEAFVLELERAEALGLSYLVMHPGAHVGSGVEAGIKRVIAAFDEVHSHCSGFKLMVLIETTAGQGTTLGHRFEQIEAIIQGVNAPDRLGVCLDTCHVFAAGYPLDTAKEYAATFKEFDSTIGLEKLKLFHLNDSAKPFNSRVDRHAAIGQGRIGLEAFRRLVRDKRFRAHPMILETPKENENGEPMDAVNLGILRGLLSNSKTNPAT